MAVRYALARRKAAELLKGARVKRPPVPVEHLASRIGAIVRYQPFDGDISGMMQRLEDDTTVIGVNSMHPETRCRFTIAHELGHVLLHTDEDFHIDERFPLRFRDDVSSMAVDDDEIEANQFAAELLMPRELLLKDIKKLPDIESDDVVTELARRYGVSVQAMTVRLTSLGVYR